MRRIGKRFVCNKRGLFLYPEFTAAGSLPERGITVEKYRSGIKRRLVVGRFGTISGIGVVIEFGIIKSEFVATGDVFGIGHSIQRRAVLERPFVNRHYPRKGHVVDFRPRKSVNLHICKGGRYAVHNQIFAHIKSVRPHPRHGVWQIQRSESGTACRDLVFVVQQRSEGIGSHGVKFAVGRYRHLLQRRTAGKSRGAYGLIRRRQDDFFDTVVSFERFVGYAVYRITVGFFLGQNQFLVRKIGIHQTRNKSVDYVVGGFPGGNSGV